MTTRNKWLLVVTVVLVLAILMSGCGQGAAQLGTKDNPIVVVFVPSGEAGKVLAAGTAITDKLTEMTGLTYKAEVPTSFTAAVEAMCAKKAHVGALNTFSYVLAQKRKCAEVSLVSVRNNSPTYTGQIITRADSGITKIEDLKGKTFCRPDPNSTSGWVMPALILKAAGIDPDKDLAAVKDAGGHPGVVKAVYNKECDAGATFGDARSNVAADLPDVMDQVVVIATTAAIPNDTVAFEPSVPAEIRDKVTQGLLDMAAKEDTLKLLTDLYSWTGLQKVDDTFYDPFRQFLQAAGVEIETFVK